MKKIAILIVDDDADDRYLLTRQLKDTGMDLTIFEADDGKSALEFYDNHDENRLKYPDVYPPLVTFLDINMPLMNGFEFLDGFSGLRQKHSIASSVVMMFSSSEQEEDKAKAYSFDFVKGYLVKGQFTSKELKGRIDSLLIECGVLP